MIEEGDAINDCYMSGIGELSDIGCPGEIEHIGEDYVIVRNRFTNKPIFVNKSREEFEQFLANTNNDTHRDNT